MIGKTVSHYEIQEKLGAGGMGIVYRARDTRLHRDVALKFLPPHLAANEESRNRFKQEARAASALDHPNICTIHDIDETDDGQTFIAMGFYRGKTLDEIMASGEMSIEESCSIVRQVAAGLARAHDRGIVHRDIKPSNILISDEGVAKILDFGLAKLAGTADITKDGSTVGTAAYMSPEQTRGEHVDGRTDIWSLAVVLFELLTGKRPFDGDYEHAITYSILNEEAPTVTSIQPDVDAGLSDIVDKCLTKSPRERWSSMRDLHAALGQYASEDPSAVGVGSAGTDANPLRTLTIFSVAGGIVLSLVYVLMISLGLPDWVFPTAVVLMLAGLPVMYLASNAEYRRTKGKTGFAANRALDKLLTVRKASLGGVGVFTGLALAVAAYMFMRASGIGPFGTLVASGALDTNPSVIVSEFESPPTDSTVAQTVSEALRIDLGQSTVVELFERKDAAQALQRMNRSVSTRISLAVANEIAAREGIDAVVTGEVSQIGTGYVLSLLLLQSSDGTTLLSLRETAADLADLIPAVDRLSQRLRERIGESIKDVRDTPSLIRVTTPSLSALQYFTRAEQHANVGDMIGSLELLQSAVREDSMFAMAHRKMAVVLANMGRIADSREASLRAYAHRHRLPEYERALTEAYYFTSVDSEPERAIAAYESILAVRPDDYIALNNISLIHDLVGRNQDSERYLSRLVQVMSSPISWGNYFVNLVATGQNDRARAALDSVGRHPDDQLYRTYAGSFFYINGNFASADSTFRVLRNEPAAVAIDKWDGYRGQAMLRYLQGQPQNAQRLIELYEAELAEDSEFEYLKSRLEYAMFEALAAGQKEKARSIISDALGNVSFESIDIEDRPYRELAIALAASGDTERARSYVERYYAEVPLDRRWDNEPQYARAIVNLYSARADLALPALEESTSYLWLNQMYFHARAYELLGRPGDAIRVYERYLNTLNWLRLYSDGIYLVPVLLRLSELYIENNDTDDAIEMLTRFVTLWENAEPELQPMVQNARSQLDTLLTGKARESN